MYQEITGGKGNVRRVIVMIPTTVLLYAILGKFSYALMKARGHHRSPLAWAKYLWAVFGRDGLMRRIAPDYVRYLSPSFHPNHLDDRATLEKTKRLVASWAS